MNCSTEQKQAEDKYETGELGAPDVGELESLINNLASFLSFFNPITQLCAMSLRSSQ